MPAPTQTTSNTTPPTRRPVGQRRRGRSSSQRLVLATLGVVVIALSAILSPIAGALTLPTTPEHHQRLVADWVAAQLEDEIPLTTWSPDWGVTLEAAIALISSGAHDDIVDDTWSAITANLSDVLDPFGDPSPGRYARVILLAQARGEDPYDVAGIDVVAGLTTMADPVTGLYGSGMATWDGVARQALAVLALIEAGETVPEPAISWILDQQCDDFTNTAFYGSWMMEVPAGGCVIDDVNFVAPDTNATAMAVAALDAFITAQGFANPADDADALDRVDLGITWLSNEQNSDGGWGLNIGFDSDPNSTGVILQALQQLGLASDARFDQDGATPWTYLVSLQLVCVDEVADRGAFEFPLMGPGPDMFATVQAFGGLSGGYVPSVPASPLGDFAVDCTVPTTTTTTSTTTTTTLVSPTTTAPDVATPVPPSDQQPTPTTPEQSDPLELVNANNDQQRDNLAHTGAEAGPLTVTAVLLLVVGAVLITASARSWRFSSINSSASQ